jgi:hypothetical protein
MQYRFAESFQEGGGAKSFFVLREHDMITGGRTINAAECADRAGKHAFGLNDAKAVAALRKLADDIEAGTVALFSVTTSSHATHEEFTVREVVIEVLEEYPSVGPRMVKESP